MLLQAELGPLGAVAVPPVARPPALGRQVVVLGAEPALAPDDLLQLPPGLLEDAAVDEDHDHQRDVEGDDGGGDGIRRVGVEVAAVGVANAADGIGLVGGPPLHVDGQEGDETGHQPDRQDHHAGPPLGQQRLVAEGRGDGEVAVQRDHTERLDARRHAQHVQRRPELPQVTPFPYLASRLTQLLLELSSSWAGLHQRGGVRL